MYNNEENKEYNEQEKQKMNIVIRGIPESDTEKVNTLNTDITDLISTKFGMHDVMVYGVHRVGKKKPETNRAIVCTLLDARKRAIILENARIYLKDSFLYVSEDRTPSQQKARREAYEARCYIPHRESPFYGASHIDKNNPFEDLYADVNHYRQEGTVMIIGDMNARTANAQMQVADLMTKPAMEYQLDALDLLWERCSKDPITNPQGAVVNGDRRYPVDKNIQEVIAVVDVDERATQEMLERFKIDPTRVELPPFPDVPVFESMQAFLLNVQKDSTEAYDFSKFVMQTMELPSFLRLKSLQNLRKVFLYTVDHGIHKKRQIQLQSDSHAAFTLLRSVRQCFDRNSDELADVVGDIIATMGIEDPHAVVFSVPGFHKGPEFSSFLNGGYSEYPGSQMNSAVSDDVFKAILLELKTYLLDEHALVIELTVQTLKGMLSTEKGCRVLKSMQPKDSNYLSVFSRGPNEKTVEDLLNTMKIESMRKSIPLENDVLWDVNGKVYDEWVCSLVYSLTHYCEDTTLRLCQGIVHCKSFLAECLLPHVLRSLAASSGVKSNICRLISCQVAKHIFTGWNQNTRSIQLFLDALNELRRCDVVSRMKLGQDYTKRQEKSKVYWLELDYLQTAEVAQKCGAYFTSALYVEHWCEEKFGRLSLGDPDFSDEEELPLHMNLLLTIYTQINEPDGVYGVVRSHKLSSQIRLFEHEGNWSRAVGSYDLLLRKINVRKGQKEVVDETRPIRRGLDDFSSNQSLEWSYNKGLMRSLQRTGSEHVLKMYCEGLALEKESLEQDIEFQELQFESAWRAGKWDFCYLVPKIENAVSNGLAIPRNVRFHSNLYWHSLSNPPTEDDSGSIARSEQLS
ncbi:hypothetical protein L7F22_017769 [Adiantum nelumboides]|nr:hypothetical protein [Adiantum nelumboides]